MKEKINDKIYYKNILILFDEDNDKRIYNFIDSLNEEELTELFSASEEKAQLTLEWHTFIPKRFLNVVGIEIEGPWQENGKIGKINYDYWTIENKIICDNLIIDEDYEYIEENEKEIYRIITKEQRYKIIKRQKWKCNNCGCGLKYSINSSWEGEVAHIDHIHPYTKRNTYPNGPKNINELENLQALCSKCNLKKGRGIN